MLSFTSPEVVRTFFILVKSYQKTFVLSFLFFQDKLGRDFGIFQKSFFDVFRI